MKNKKTQVLAGIIQTPQQQPALYQRKKKSEKKGTDRDTRTRNVYCMCMPRNSIHLNPLRLLTALPGLFVLCLASHLSLSVTLCMVTKSPF